MIFDRPIWLGGQWVSGCKGIASDNTPPPPTQNDTLFWLPRRTHVRRDVQFCERFRQDLAVLSGLSQSSKDGRGTDGGGGSGIVHS